MTGKNPLWLLALLIPSLLLALVLGCSSSKQQDETGTDRELTAELANTDTVPAATSTVAENTVPEVSPSAVPEPEPSKVSHRKRAARPHYEDRVVAAAVPEPVLTTTIATSTIPTSSIPPVPKALTSIPAREEIKAPKEPESSGTSTWLIISGLVVMILGGAYGVQALRKNKD